MDVLRGATAGGGALLEDAHAVVVVTHAVIGQAQRRRHRSVGKVPNPDSPVVHGHAEGWTLAVFLAAVFIVILLIALGDAQMQPP
ncbi:MAG: hypothetical protein M3137_14675 [Actinomycetota bacterium]|nr:hypothetical protein [Actinomycetota bacterium]